MPICARLLWLPLTVASLFFATTASAVVTFNWMPVDDPGNACDVQPQGCFGAVARSFQISEFEVTNDQYMEYLNAVAATDTNALYNVDMGSVPLHGGITRSGSSGSFSYSTIAGRENMPVNYVSFFDTLRFANWLHNGQPTGAQDNTTTESGAYDLSLGDAVQRISGARVYLPSENQWYKAAYYDTGSMVYFDYPAGTDAQTVCTTPGATANTANCGSFVGDVTIAGSYTASASPNGTFDQGGNVWEWNEAVIISADRRGLRGGAWELDGGAEALLQFSAPGTDEGEAVGFRVAIPVATVVPSMSPLGIVTLAGLLVAVSWRRLRA